MELVTTHICKTSELGVHNNMFGGTMIALIDEASAAYASQICDTPKIVTIKIEELLFKNPVKIGNILKIYASVKEFGNSSITLYVEMRKHNVYTGLQEVVIQTTIKFVSIDEDGRAKPISSRVKLRHERRMAKYGKGLLSTEELQLETE